MRLYIKKQCLEMLETLAEANGEIRRLIEGKDWTSVLPFLEDCQQSAISVGNAIDRACGENNEGSKGGGDENDEGVEGSSNENNEGTGAVRALEQYCESLYILHERIGHILSHNTNSVLQEPDTGDLNPALQEPDTVEANSILQELDAEIAACREELTDRVSTEKEVVFLPYKASMWDALEFAWRKKAAEPGCTALVVPIPYYDRNADTTLGERHYEIDEFPDDVPVISCEEYDFAGRHPDAIYIHNPYDEYNRVTCVDPRFFSRNLKQYTDELVYIPYFVLNEPDLNNEAQMQHLAELAWMPAVVNADRVIVQSEAMRQAYIKICTEKAGPDQQQDWAAKIEGTGSPKIDKVKSLKREDFTLPEAWEALIAKPDGGRKKVVFYNTTVSTLLNSNEDLLTKIKNVLAVFYSERKNIVLWWRPHPLMEATLASMRPELLDEYRRIVSAYREAGWGIYDDSPDMDRAIACSDAYYGDMSSIVWLYEYTGKPIMIENTGILEEMDGE